MFLGVDGGGTKTALCLVTDDGRVAATVQAPSCYYLGKREGVALVERVLRDGVAAVCRLAGIAPAEIAYGFVALPSYGEVSADIPALDAAPRAVLGHDRYAAPPIIERICFRIAGSSGIAVFAGSCPVFHPRWSNRKSSVLPEI